MPVDPALVGRLEAAGRALDVPDRDLVPAVTARLPLAPDRRPPAPARPRVVLVAVLVLLLVAAVAIAADLVPGVRLAPAERPPSSATPLEAPLHLGVPASLDDAGAAAGLEHVSVPAVPGLPEPTIHLDGTLVHLAYPPTDALPELADSGVGLLVTQWAAEAGDQVLLKAVPGDGVRTVEVGDVTGWWITGPHEVVPDGDHVTGRWRRADDVLLWHRDGTTYRLESRLPLERVLEIARSL